MLLSPVRDTFRAIAITVVPEASSLDEPGWSALEALVEKTLARRPPAIRRQLVIFVRVLEHLPRLRWGCPFTALSPEERARFSRASSAPVLLLERGFWGLRIVFLATCAARGGRRDRLPRRRAWLGRATRMIEKSYDVVVIGSGAGGGTVAEGLAPLARAATDPRRRAGPAPRGIRITGREEDMADALYEDGGGFLTADGAMTLAFGRVWGGSTVVYTGRPSSRRTASSTAGACRAFRTRTSSAAPGASWTRTASTFSSPAS